MYTVVLYEKGVAQRGFEGLDMSGFYVPARSMNDFRRARGSGPDHLAGPQQCCSRRGADKE